MTELARKLLKKSTGIFFGLKSNRETIQCSIPLSTLVYKNVMCLVLLIKMQFRPFVEIVGGLVLIIYTTGLEIVKVNVVSIT